jgi:hypothetical protein
MPRVRVPTDPEDAAKLLKARDDALAMIEAVEAALAECLVAPAAGSEIETCATKDPESWWMTYANLSLNNAVDHLRALAPIWSMEGGIPNAPGYTLIRATAEASVRAIWLLDPSLSPRERIARGVVERQNAHQWMRRIQGDGDDTRRRETTFAATLNRSGFTIVDKTCEGQKRPLITTLMREQLRAPIRRGTTQTTGGLMYALLCGYAHAEPWATMLWMRPVGPGIGAVNLNIDLQVTMLRNAMKLLNGGIVGLVYLAGRDVEAWKRRAVPLVLGT